MFKIKYFIPVLIVVIMVSMVACGNKEVVDKNCSISKINAKIQDTKAQHEINMANSEKIKSISEFVFSKDYDKNLFILALSKHPEIVNRLQEIAMINKIKIYFELNIKHNTEISVKGDGNIYIYYYYCEGLFSCDFGNNTNYEGTLQKIQNFICDAPVRVEK